jgi:hypothetical protein
MHAISIFVDRLVFAGTCVVGWVIFPLLIAAGFIALLGYALIAELVVTATGSVDRSTRKTIPTP